MCLQWLVHVGLFVMQRTVVGGTALGFSMYLISRLIADLRSSKRLTPDTESRHTRLYLPPHAGDSILSTS